MRKYLFIIACCVGVVLTAQPTKAATTIASGQVQLNNASVTAGWVEMFGNNLYGGAEISNGQFTITSDETWTAGSYTLRAIPDTNAYPQNPAAEMIVSYNGTATINQTINLSAAVKQIQVNVTDENDNPVEITVQVKASGGGSGMRFTETTNNGQATFTVRPEGAPYTVTFDNCVSNADGSESCANWLYTGDPIAVNFTEADTQAETQSVSVQGTAATATVVGNITYQDQGFEGFINIYNEANSFSGWMDANGDFSIYALPGVYKVDLLPHQSQTNPDVVRYYIDEATIGGSLSIIAGANDIGNLAASYEDATIHAAAVDENGSSLTGVTINFWLAGGGEWRKVEVMPDASSAGSEAHAGTYYVNAVDSSGAHFPAPAQEIQVEAGAEPTVTLTLVSTNATENFTVLNSDGSRAATFNSFINCWDETNNRGNGVTITRGSASIALIAGTYTCTASTPNNGTASMAPVEITIGVDETQSTSLTLVNHSATLTGTLTDQTGSAIAPADDADQPLTIVLEGETYGQFSAAVNEDGTWSKTLPPDTYSVSADGEEIIPLLGKAAKTVTLTADETHNQSLTAAVADAIITTQVFEPDGETPLPFTQVTCSYFPAGEKGDFAGGRIIEVAGETNEAGAVTIPVLSADGDVALTYACNPGVTEASGFIAPAVKTVAPGDDVNFKVFAPDSTITVNYEAKDETVSLESTQCQAWTEAGSAMVTGADDDADGQVELEVSKKAGTTWNVTCSGTDDAAVFTPTAPETVTINQAGNFETSLKVVENDTTIPQASSESFDGTTEKQLTLDGIEVIIPANTIESDGEATLAITPTATDTPTNEQNVIVGVPLNVQAFNDDGGIKTDFTNAVTLTIPYDENALAEAKVLEADLIPKFYNEMGGTWETIPTYQINTEENTITFNTTHFTQFALLYNSTIAGQAPAKVKNVKVPKKYLANEQAKVTWKKVSTAETYQLKLLNKKGKKIQLFKNIESKSQVIKKRWLNPGKKYKVKVRAVGTNGLYGSWSKVKSFTTLTTAT